MVSNNRYYKKYLGIGSSYSPTHKDIADNLRAYLTVVAFAAGIAYMWDIKGLNPLGSLLTRATAVIWSAWISWFFWLTYFQSAHLILYFFREITDFLYFQSHPNTKFFNRIRRALAIIIVILFFIMAIFFIFSTEVLIIFFLRRAGS